MSPVRANNPSILSAFTNSFASSPTDDAWKVSNAKVVDKGAKFPEIDATISRGSGSSAESHRVTLITDQHAKSRATLGKQAAMLNAATSNGSVAGNYSDGGDFGQSTFRVDNCWNGSSSQTQAAKNTQSSTAANAHKHGHRAHHPHASSSDTFEPSSTKTRKASAAPAATQAVRG